jgi:hypothetical protein
MTKIGGQSDDKFVSIGGKNRVRKNHTLGELFSRDKNKTQPKHLSLFRRWITHTRLQISNHKPDENLTDFERKMTDSNLGEFGWCD